MLLPLVMRLYRVGKAITLMNAHCAGLVPSAHALLQVEKGAQLSLVALE